MKRWRATLILLGVFVALLAYVLAVEVKKDAPPEQEGTAEPTPVPLLDVSTGDVRAVRIESDRPGVTALRLAYQEGEWQITEPGASPADTYTVSWAVGELARLEARLIVDEAPSDLGVYDLSPPRLTLTIEIQGGLDEQLSVGRETPDGTAFYVQRLGDPRVYIVGHYKLEPFFEWLVAPPLPPTPTPGAKGG
jgi:hypothetical protein